MVSFKGSNKYVLLALIFGFNNSYAQKQINKKPNNGLVLTPLSYQ